MSEAYIVSVENLKELIIHFKESERNVLLKYVPMGSNYCVHIHGCDRDSDSDKKNPCSHCNKKIEKDSLSKINHRMTRNYNELNCYYFDTEYYNNTSINLEEHMNRTHPPPGHNIVVDHMIFEKIIKNMMLTSNPLQMLLRQKCLYDSSMKETYQYNVETHRIVKLYDLYKENAPYHNPMICEWMDSVAIRGFATNENAKKELIPESYESLYKSTQMTIRQHVEMYMRDSDQCNHNTVYYAIKYNLLMSQNQFDLLKNAYLNNQNLKELLVIMLSVENTNSVIKFIGSREPIYRPLTYEEIRPQALSDIDSSSLPIRRTGTRKKNYDCEIS